MLRKDILTGSKRVPPRAVSRKFPAGNFRAYISGNFRKYGNIKKLCNIFSFIGKFLIKFMSWVYVLSPKYNHFYQYITNCNDLFL